MEPNVEPRGTPDFTIKQNEGVQVIQRNVCYQATKPMNKTSVKSKIAE
jgi:hypothetical protein